MDRGIVIKATTAEIGKDMDNDEKNFKLLQQDLKAKCAVFEKMAVKEKEYGTMLVENSDLAMGIIAKIMRKYGDMYSKQKPRGYQNLIGAMKRNCNGLNGLKVSEHK